MSDSDNYVHIHFIDVIDDDGDQSDYHFYISEIKIQKGGNVEPPPKGYKRARIDKPPLEKNHIHIYKNKEYVVIYVDGTRWHGNGPIKIPKKLFDWIKKHFPDFDLPKDRIIQYRSMPIRNCNYSMTIDIENNFWWQDI